MRNDKVKVQILAQAYDCSKGNRCASELFPPIDDQKTGGWCSPAVLLLTAHAYSMMIEESQRVITADGERLLPTDRYQGESGGKRSLVTSF